jgi:hypothetical protein
MIKPKEKACKGTGQAKGYGCGKLTYHRVYGLGKMCCYSKWLLTSEAGRIKMHKAIFKAAAPRLDMDKQIASEKKTKDLETLKKQVMNICHKYIRLRDKGLPCISCDAKWNDQFQAGHLFKAELYSNLKYHECNILGQCRVCNLHKQGNENEYALRLPARIGQKNFETVQIMAAESKKQSFKWDRQELKALYIYYREKIKTL